MVEKTRLVDNGRLKMVASAFSNIGVAAVVLGFLPPYLNNTSGYEAAMSVGAGLVCGLTLHVCAWSILGRLKT